jgi:hypothetical protein
MDFPGGDRKRSSPGCGVARLSRVMRAAA